jgi:hypothetical protein
LIKNKLFLKKNTGRSTANHLRRRSRRFKQSARYYIKQKDTHSRRDTQQLKIGIKIHSVHARPPDAGQARPR